LRGGIVELGGGDGLRVLGEEDDVADIFGDDGMMGV
jgi:hypothetical protein